jgi:tetratricopeptide (TPR) repeat protein
MSPYVKSMPKLFAMLTLYFRLFWHHLVFWTFPTLEESHYCNLGTVYYELCKYSKAISAFEKSENAHNNHDASFSKCNWQYLGYCYLNLGDFKNAVKYFENYLNFNREDYETISIIAWCYELLDELELSVDWYLKALEIEPDVLEIHLEYSKLLADLGREEEALNRLKICSSKADSPIEGEIIEAMSLKINGDTAAAVNKLKQAIEKIDNVPDDSAPFLKEDIHIVLAKFRKESGDPRAALSTLEFALQENVDDLWLINEIAIEYAEQGVKLEKALNLINRALTYQPDNPLFLDTKGWTLFKLGEIEKAKRAVQKSLELNPNYKEAQVHYKAILEY